MPLDQPIIVQESFKTELTNALNAMYFDINEFKKYSKNLN